MNKPLKDKNTILDILFRIFHIETTPNESVEDIKANLLKLIVYILNVMGIPVIILSIIMAVQINEFIIALGYFLFFIPVIVAYFFIKRANYKLSILLIIFTAYLIAIKDFVTFGYYGMGIPIFLTIFVISSIFFKLKTALLMVLLSAIPMIIIAYLYTNEILIFNFYNLIKVPVSWIAAIFLLVFLGSIIVVSFGFILYKMEEKVIFSELQAVKLAEDISGQKKTEKALKESQEKYKVLVETINDWIWETDKDGIFTYSSPKVHAILGYSEKEIIGKSPYDFMPEKEKERVSEIFGHITGNKGFIDKIENVNIHKDGHLVVLETSGAPYFDANNNLLGYRGVDREISEIKKNQLALIKNEEQLRKSNKTKDKFFSIIAHDLRSPFNTMLGFSNLLVDRYDEFDNEEQKKFIGILNQDIKSTYNLLENLLLWSRTQSETIDFKPVKENLYLLSVETVSLLKQSAKNKFISIINNIDESIFVNADRNMLLTVLRNLISNAIKFTPKSGQIEMNTRLLKDKNKLGFVELSVADNGVGIANDKLDKLFKLSENTSTQGTNRETGTGLGLIICKEFIGKHGGKIRVESEIGKGSTFIFTIPQII